jgi:NifU-like protein involved in Fe-S cluster formation
MSTLTSEEQLSSLQNILFQLQISASKVSDAEFKRDGCTGLMHSIQQCKKLIKMAEQLSVYDQISQYTDSLEDYSNSLGISNIV